MAIFGLNAGDDCNELVKVKLDENDIVEHILSGEDFYGKTDELDERLLKSIIVSNSRLLTFRPSSVYIHDVSNLLKVHAVHYNDFLPV